jgi:aconitate hydratase
MGVLPLQFPGGKTADDMGLTGDETLSISGITALNDGTTPRTVTVKIESADGERSDEFEATVRIDTPGEAHYYRNGGIMPYVLRNLLKG